MYFENIVLSGAVLITEVSETREGPDSPDLYQPRWKQEEMMMKVVMMIIFKIKKVW